MTSLDGPGNIREDPRFTNPYGPEGDIGIEDDDLHLAPASPCIDARDNTDVPADSPDLDADGDTRESLPFDTDGYARRMDDFDTPDSGIGTLPIVDIGAHEYWTACNKNGVPDAVGIADATSTDCNANHIPQECEFIGGRTVSRRESPTNAKPLSVAISRSTTALT